MCIIEHGFIAAKGFFSVVRLVVYNLNFLCFYKFISILKKFETFNMVYIHIPEALTEEEQMLMAKYAKLKKKVRFSTNIPRYNIKSFSIIIITTNFRRKSKSKHSKPNQNPKNL